jgi:hypothetical protein
LGVPTRVELFRSLPAVLAGDAAAGLDALNGSVSSASAVSMWVVATEVVNQTPSMKDVEQGEAGDHDQCREHDRDQHSRKRAGGPRPRRDSPGSMYGRRPTVLA